MCVCVCVLGVFSFRFDLAPNLATTNGPGAVAPRAVALPAIVPVPCQIRRRVGDPPSIIGGRINQRRYNAPYTEYTTP